MKKLLLLLLYNFLTIFLFAQDSVNSIYDLSVGTVRYYSSCGALGIPCAGNGSYTLAIEKVMNKTLISSKIYSVILFEKYIHSEPDNTNKYFTDTLYQIIENKKLYQHTTIGDSLIADFSFSKGDSLYRFFNYTSGMGGYKALPKVIIYDTTKQFLDGKNYRFLWSDDTTQYSHTPNLQSFLDSILIPSLSDSLWLLPIGSNSVYSVVHPFYFVESLGIIRNYYTHLNLPMVGIMTADGKLFGEKFLITKIKGEKTSPELFYLYQNFPNPFNPTTKIKYQLPKDGFVTLKVYDILGREVKTLVNEYQSKGRYDVTLNAENLASGIYIYQLIANDFIANKKLVLLR